MTGTCRTKAPALTAAWVAALAIGVTAVISGAVRAETIAVDDQVSVRESNVDRPGRGMTMKRVEAKFGAPQERHPAVGKPAITQKGSANRARAKVKVARVYARITDRRTDFLHK